MIRRMRLTATPPATTAPRRSRGRFSGRAKPTAGGPGSRATCFWASMRWARRWAPRAILPAARPMHRCCWCWTMSAGPGSPPDQPGQYGSGAGHQHDGHGALHHPPADRPGPRLRQRPGAELREQRESRLDDAGGPAHRRLFLPEHGGIGILVDLIGGVTITVTWRRSPSTGARPLSMSASGSMWMTRPTRPG